MATKHIFGLPVELIMVLMFIAVFALLVMLLAPDMHGGFIGALFDALKSLAGIFGGF